MRHFVLSEKVKWYITFIIFFFLLLNTYIQRITYIEYIRKGVIQGQTIYLNDDAKEYYRLGLEKEFPCYSTFRDPFILIVARSVCALFGDIHAVPGIDDLHNNELLRTTSVIINMLALCMLFAFTLLAVNRSVALTVAFLWSSNIWSIFYSVGFLRVDIVNFFHFTILTLMIILFRVKKKKLIYTSYSAIAVAGACLILTRMSSAATFILIMTTFNLIKYFFKKWRRIDLYGSFASLSVALLLISPFLIHNRNETGYCFSSSNGHARFWRNEEFAGKDGYPTRAEVAENPYRGAKTTPFEYIWGDHSILEIIGRYIHGYYKASTHYLYRLYKFIFPFEIFSNFLNIAILLCALPGAVLCALKREKGILILAGAVIFIFPFIFIIPLDTVLGPLPMKTGVEPRFTMPLLPFAFIFSAIFLSWCGEKISARYAQYSNDVEGRKKAKRK